MSQVPTEYSPPLIPGISKYQIRLQAKNGIATQATLRLKKRESVIPPSIANERRSSEHEEYGHRPIEYTFDSKRQNPVPAGRKGVNHAVAMQIDYTYRSPDI